MTKRVLGRGLDALIPAGLSATPTGTVGAAEIVPSPISESAGPGGKEWENGEVVHLVPMEKVAPNPRQPRRQFDEVKLGELSQGAASMELDPTDASGNEYSHCTQPS